MSGEAVMIGVDALLFDVFGTVVDWRKGVAREVRTLLGPGVDAHAIADAWRGRYQPLLEEVRSGRRSYVRLDVLHRAGLLTVLDQFGVETPDESTLSRLVTAWHRLDPWPDARPGLERLRGRYLVATLSNGDVGLMARLARHGGLGWDAVLGAGFARAYKPRPEVYLASCDALDLRPERCLMVAAHSSDLAAAAAVGMRTAHVARPDEHGPGKGEAGPSVPCDLAASDLLDLARQLGC